MCGFSFEPNVDWNLYENRDYFLSGLKGKLFFEGEDVLIIQIANMFMNNGFASDVVLFGVEEKNTKIYRSKYYQHKFSTLINPAQKN